MLSFTSPFLPSHPRIPRPTAVRTVCSLRSSDPASALDDVSPSVKLNAVAEALARRRDYPAAIRLLQEMSTAKVSLDPQALSTIVDSAVLAPNALASLLRTAAPPGYASHTLPSATHPDPHPIDPERPADLSLAVSFLVLVTGAVSAELLEPPLVHHSADEATSVLLLLFTALLFDRYAAAAATWQRISAGLARIFADDPVRTARVDAAHFLVAYVLGLPWMCFRPDADQIIKFHSSRHGEGSSSDIQIVDDMSDAEMDIYLVWLVAGVACEDAQDGKLIDSDLKGARALLRAVTRARRKRGNTESEEKSVGSHDRIQTALAHANEILERYHLTHTKVAEKMLKGGSVGECVVEVADAFT